MSIAWKELYAIVAGIWSLVHLHGPHVVMGRRLFPVLDNLGIVRAIPKRGSTSVRINELLEWLVWTQVWLKFELGNSKWISTADNLLMDAYTRMPAHIDATLRQDIFDLLALRWGPFIIDLMATDASAKCQTFFSRFACPGTAAVDVLTQHVPSPAYCFPPLGFIAPILAHLKQCEATAAVLLPTAPAPWSPVMLGACVDSVPLVSDLLPFAFESTREGLVPSAMYNQPYAAFLLDFRRR